MIDRELEYTKMAAAENKLWWYRALHHLVINTLKKNRIPTHANILDAGCGTGGLMEALKKAGYNNVQGVDLSENAVQFCRQKNLNVICDDVCNVENHFSNSAFNVIVSNDVLCYFTGEAQRNLINTYSRLLANNGLLILNLPALKAFGGIHDISVGIKHRFNSKDINLFADPTVLQLKRKRYWPFLLSPLIFGVRSIQRLRIKLDKNVAIVSDVSVPSMPVNAFFREITKMEFNVLPSTPFGSSLFTIFQKNVSS